MNIAPEERVNMSLDDLVKASRKATPTGKKPSGKKGGPKNTGPKTPQSKGGKGKVNTPKSQNSGMKMAQSIGAGKAKRAALTNQRRGLNSTGKASQMDIDRAVTRETKRIARPIILQGAAGAATSGKKNNRRRKSGEQIAGPPGNKPAKTTAATGLKISFKPSELSQTTDKNVFLQIRGALAKSTTGGGGAPKQPKQNQANNGARSVAVNGGGGNNGGSRKRGILRG